MFHPSDHLGALLWTHPNRFSTLPVPQLQPTAIHGVSPVPLTMAITVHPSSCRSVAWIESLSHPALSEGSSSAPVRSDQSISQDCVPLPKRKVFAHKRTFSIFSNASPGPFTVAPVLGNSFVQPSKDPTCLCQSHSRIMVHS